MIISVLYTNISCDYSLDVFKGVSLVKDFIFVGIEHIYTDNDLSLLYQMVVKVILPDLTCITIIMILSFQTEKSIKTVQTLIRLLL